MPPEAGEIADKQSYPHQVDHDGDARLLPKAAPAVAERQPDEDQLAESGHGQDPWPARRIIRSFLNRPVVRKWP